MNPRVFNYLKLRALTCWREADLLRRGFMPAPRMAILYPTYRCSHDCLGCDYAGLNRTGRQFTPAQFRRAVDQVLSLGVKGIEFCGGGEPTLHPSLPAMMRRAADAGAAFGLLTNGTGLGPELRELLVERGSYCRVSLESASEKVFNAYKRPRSRQAGFNAILGNIKALTSLRAARKPASRLQVSIKFSVDRNNYGDIAASGTLAASLGADSLQFKLIRNVPSEIMEPRLLARLARQGEALKARYPGLHISHGFTKTELKGACWLSPLQLTVDPLGDVYICCYYRHRGARHCLGNLFKTPLEKIWYSTAHFEKIKKIRRAECNKYDCRFHGYNELLKGLVAEGGGQFEFI